jgi:hypothetical protein
MDRCLTTAICLGLLLVAEAGANELTGRVLNLKGEPLAGATVFVSTAAPREGVAIFCPSCYLDCGKKTTTDGAGRFTLSDLDPSLVFHLVATADGYRAGGSRRNVDPAKQKAEIELEPLPGDLAPGGWRGSEAIREPQRQPTVVGLGGDCGRCFDHERRGQIHHHVARARRRVRPRSPLAPSRFQEFFVAANG